MMGGVCMDHWSKLRAAVEARGLMEYVAPDGAAEAAMLKDQVEVGEPTLANWDPLMGAYMKIVSNGIALMGPYILNEPCIICFLNTKRTEDGSCACDEPDCEAKKPGSIPDFETWVDKSVEGQQAYAKEKGWVS